MISSSIFKEERHISARRDIAAIAIMDKTTTEIDRSSEKRECMVKARITTYQVQ